MKTLITFLLCMVIQTIAQAETTEADALAFLKKHAPDIHAKLTALKSADAADYANALEDAIQATEEHAKIEASGDTEAAAAHVKMYRIDFAAIALSDQILRTKDESEKQVLTTQLRQLISDSFDQWTIVEQARIRRIEKELNNLKTDLQKAITDRDKVIDSDTQKLIEESKAYQATKKAK